MTDCPRADMRDALPDLLSGRLDAATRTAVERHVAACSACADELAMLRAARAAMTAPAIDVGRITRGVVAATVAAQPAAMPSHLTNGVRDIQSARSARRAAWRAAAAVATIAVGVVGYSLVQRSGRGHAATPVAVATPAPRVTPVPPPTTVASATPAPSVAPRASEGLVIDGGVTDLPASDLRALLESLDSLRAEPDPNPMPVGYQIPEDTL